jgi:hypothetical protein
MFAFEPARVFDTNPQSEPCSKAVLTPGSRPRLEGGSIKCFNHEPEANEVEDGNEHHGRLQSTNGSEVIRVVPVVVATPIITALQEFALFVKAFLGSFRQLFMGYKFR